MTVGIVNPEYNTRRNILNRCFPVEYIRVRSFNSLFRKFNIRIGPGAAFWGGVHRKPFNRIDLYHFWNVICVTPSRKTPYITSFEDVVPRYFNSQRAFNEGIRSLCSRQCRKLIAFSECAKMHQIKFNAQNNLSDLDKKVTVLLPPQDVLATSDDVKERDLDGCIRFGFIGKAFFRKGGMAICKALARVRKEYPIELFVIGDIEYFDYAGNPTVDDCAAAYKFFEQHKEWAHYFKVLPNASVLELMKSCHVGLLPTRDDTFGYSLLEMQACGLPCITTDIWSLPEVNNSECGWVIHLEKNDLRQADYFSNDAIRVLDGIIEEGIYQACMDALSDREKIRQKGLKSLERIHRFHSPAAYSDALGKIYQEALGQ